MTKREQTTKEREAQEGTARQAKAKHTARVVLGALMATRGTMQQFPSKESKKIIEEVSARIEWLVEESETYRDVVAEMWLSSQQGYSMPHPETQRDGCPD